MESCSNLEAGLQIVKQGIIKLRRNIMERLQDEMDVREWLINRIEGITGVYEDWGMFSTVGLVKMYLALIY